MSNREGNADKRPVPVARRSRRVVWLVIAGAHVAVAGYVAVRAMRRPVAIGDAPADGTVFRPASELGFDGSKDLKDWPEISFNGHSKYSLETDGDGVTYLKASSKDACSGIFRQVEVSMKGRPHLSWEWRVTKFPSNKKEGGSLAEKADCDFAARVCAVFAGDSPFTSHYIYYVWDDRFPEGTHADSSGSFKRTRILVVEDSAGGEGSEWVSERRDVIGDYQTLFGKNPTRAFHSVGIVTDSDGTHTESAAEFRNVRITTAVRAGDGDCATGSGSPE